MKSTFAPRAAAVLGAVLVGAVCFGQNFGTGGASLFGSNGGFTETANSLAGVHKIAFGENRAVLLRNDGSAMAWGIGQQTGDSLVPTLEGYSDVAVGANHILALSRDGVVRSFGLDPNGTVYPFAQISQPKDRTAAAVAAGSQFSLVLYDDGGVQDVGTVVGSPMPSNLPKISAIAGALSTRMALTETGGVRVWGDNTFGQESVPLSASSVWMIATSGRHCLALRRNGTVVGWGRNLNGEATIPAGLSSVVDIAATDQVSYALLASGSIVAWGNSSLIDGKGLGKVSGIVQIYGGPAGASAISSAGAYTALGATNVFFPAPPQKPNATRLFGVMPDRVALGDASRGASFVYNRRGFAFNWFADLQDVTAMALGPDQFMAISFLGGSMVAPPGYPDPRTQHPTYFNSTQLVSSLDHCAAVNGSGHAIAWGASNFGKIDIPMFTAADRVAVGRHFTAVVQPDGTLLLYGDPAIKDNVPQGLPPLDTVVAGDNHIVCLAMDGSVWAWGDNSAGQIDLLPYAASPVTSIAAAANHTIITFANGETLFAGEFTGVMPASNSGYLNHSRGSVMSSSTSVLSLSSLHIIPLQASATTTTPLQFRVTVPSAPQSDLTINVSCENPRVTVPDSVVVPAGQTQATFAAVSTSGFVGDFGIIVWLPSATAGPSNYAWGRFVPASDGNTVHVRESTLVGGQAFQGVLSLSEPAPAGGLMVRMWADEASVQPWVFIPGGMEMAPFRGTTQASTSFRQATIYAAFPRGTSYTVLNLTEVRIDSLSLNLPSIRSGNSTDAIVRISGPAPAGGLSIPITVNDARVTVPATVQIPAGRSSATFTISTQASRTSILATVYAGFGNRFRHAVLTATPAQISSLVLSASEVASNASGQVTGTVAIDAPAPSGGLTVTLSSNLSALTSMPASVFIAEGETEATFLVETSPTDMPAAATIVATLDSRTRWATLALRPLEVQSVEFSQAIVSSGGLMTCTIVLNGVANDGSDYTFTITDNSPSTTHPTTVTVPGGSDRVSFTVSVGTVGAPAWVTLYAARAGFRTRFGVFRVIP